MKTRQKTNIDDLPEELVEDILHRLPINTLGLCMSVKKPWFLLIKSPRFLKANQVIKHESRRFSIIWNALKVDRFEEFTDSSDDDFRFQRYLHLPPKKYHSESTIASCNGLICATDIIEDKIILCNPVIRKVLSLPDPHYNFPNFFYLRHCLGLAFDSLTDDYKLVRIAYYQNLDHDTRVEMFSLKTFSWKFICPIASKFEFHGASVPIKNGCIHWIRSDRTSTPSDNAIVSFNVSTEEFNEVGFPQHLKGKFFSVTSANEQSTIAIFCRGLLGNLQVWVMKEYGHMESWYKMCSVDFHDTYSVNPRPMIHASIFGLRRKGEILWNMEVAETDLYYHQMQIMSTDFKRGTTKYVDLPEESRLYHANAVIRDFEESLMLLNDDRSQNYRPGACFN